MHGAVLLGRLFDGLHLLDVHRDDDTREGTLGLGDAQRAIHEMAYLNRRGGHVDILASYVLEQGNEVNLLLVMAAKGRAGLLADHRHDGLVIHLRVVKAIEQMNGARTGGSQADADLSGELGMSTSHEGGHLLVTHLDEVEFVFCPIQSSDQSIDAVTGVSKHSPYTPLRKSFPEKVRNGRTHWPCLRRGLPPREFVCCRLDACRFSTPVDFRRLKPASHNFNKAAKDCVPFAVTAIRQ